MDHKKLIDFEEVRDGIDNDSLVIIDVRNRHELVKSGPNGGRIPGTKNVPCKLYQSVYVAVPKENTEYQYRKHTEVSLPVWLFK